MTTGSDTRVTQAAIVTGSATGIGAAVARALASRGWGVAINYTRSGHDTGEWDCCRLSPSPRSHHCVCRTRTRQRSEPPSSPNRADVPVTRHRTPPATKLNAREIIWS